MKSQPIQAKRNDQNFLITNNATKFQNFAFPIEEPQKKVVSPPQQIQQMKIIYQTKSSNRKQQLKQKLIEPVAPLQQIDASSPQIKARLPTEESQKKSQGPKDSFLRGKQLSLANLNMEMKSENLQKMFTPKNNFYSISDSSNFALANDKNRFQKPLISETNKNSYLFQMQQLKNAEILSDEYNILINNQQKKLSEFSDSKPRFQKRQTFPMSIPVLESMPSPRAKKNLMMNSHKTQITEQAEVVEPQAQLSVILIYKSQKYHISMDYKNKTCNDLFHFLIQKILEFEQRKTRGVDDQLQNDLNRIVQFCTVARQVPIDYYLTLDENSLSVFKDQQLELQPFFRSIEPNRVTLKDFTLMKCIGVGGFSRVYLVKKKDTGKFYALKLIDKHFIVQNNKEGIVQNERDIMANMDNQFITPLHFAFETRYYIAFVMEYCAGGELFYHLRKLGRLKESDAKFYFVEICIGMAYLHQNGILYRDIKPENILVTLDGHLQLSDFGLSKPLDDPEEIAYSFCGSPEYMAPEMLLKTGHNYLVDCYCLGALLYELVTGLPPFYSHDTKKIYDAILNERVSFPSKINLTSDLKDLVYRLLEKNPSKRLGSQKGVLQILQHQWFREVDYDGIIKKKIPTPYHPEPLKYNFDENEFSKGDFEFRKQYALNLQKEYQPNEPANYIFKNFYFEKPSPKRLVENQQQQRILKPAQKCI